MNAEHFASWVAHMKATRGWSEARCSRELGCGINQVSIWRKREPPRYIALACAAVAYGLPPWRDVKSSGR